MRILLVPAGAAAAAAARVSGARLVVTAHGRDVRNVGSIRGVGAATRRVVHAADAVIAVSDFLRRELEGKVPGARGRTHVIDCGVDLERFRHRPADEARARIGWSGGDLLYLRRGTP